MGKLILVVLIQILFVTNVYAEELKKDKKYRVRTALEVSSDGTNYNLKVGTQSKFVVIDNSDSDKYAIKFMNIYQYGTIRDKNERLKNDYKSLQPSDVIEDEIYFLNKTPNNGVAVESKVQQSFGGLVSGPLIVPFKYRLEDESIVGDATVGYYAGWGLDTNFFGASDTYVTFTPFLSAGISQVAVGKNGESGADTENKSGFTWSTGLLIKNWGSVNIGIVYGEDRIGDKEWEHEGDGWLSISVGWEL